MGRESSGDPSKSDAVAPVCMVSVAVAFPLASKVIEFWSSEQVGAACAGCTEQVSSTGVSNEFRWPRVTVEVELCPRLTVAGLGVDAAIEKSAPVVLSSKLMLLSAEFVTAKSGALSWLKSAATTLYGPAPTATLRAD